MPQCWSESDNVIRSAVLQLHTSIEDILNSMIMCRILGVPANKRSKYMSSPRGKALRKMMMSAEGLGFDQKLDLAVALHIINEKRRKRLGVLNTLRNKCSHHWLLKAPVRRGRRPRQLKPPLLLYETHDLHQVDTFKDFLAEYGPIYINMFLKSLDITTRNLRRQFPLRRRKHRRMRKGSLSVAQVPLDAVRVESSHCGRAGTYRRDGLIERFGSDIALPDLLAELAACERRHDFSRPCGARFTDLAKR
jgi:hypothetical protein